MPHEGGTGNEALRFDPSKGYWEIQVRSQGPNQVWDPLADHYPRLAQELEGYDDFRFDETTGQITDKHRVGGDWEQGGAGPTRGFERAPDYWDTSFGPWPPIKPSVFADEPDQIDVDYIKDLEWLAESLHQPRGFNQPEIYTDPATGQQFYRGSAEGGFRTFTAPGGQADQPLQELEPRLSIEEMIAQALGDADLSNANDPNLIRAFALDDFRQRPDDAQRLQAALELARSPADYFTLLGMLRGELPIQQPSGGFGRVAPLAGFLESSAQRFFDDTGGPARPLIDPNLPTPLPSQEQPGPLGLEGYTGGGSANRLAVGALPDFLQEYPLGLEGYTGGGSANRLAEGPLPDELREYPLGLPGEGGLVQAPVSPTAVTETTSKVEPDPRVIAPDGIPNPPATSFGDLPEGFEQLAEGPSFLPYSVRRVGIEGGSLGQAVQFPSLGSLRFRSAQTRLNMLPSERAAYERAIELQGIPLQDFLQQEERATTPGGPLRRRVRFAPHRFANV